MQMMRLRGVWTTNLTGFLIGFGMYSSFVLIPQFVETPTSTHYGFGSSVTQAGLFLVLAGPILEHLNYHWLFWIPLGLIAVTIVATIVFIPESPIRAPGSVNWTGAILLSLWLICLLLAISEAPTLGLALGAGDRPDRPRGRHRRSSGSGPSCGRRAHSSTCT